MLYLDSLLIGLVLYSSHKVLEKSAYMLYEFRLYKYVYIYKCALVSVHKAQGASR